MISAQRIARWAALIAVVLVAGCDDAPPEPTVERVRAIKPYYVSEPAGGTVYRYAGVTAAATTSSLSFAVSGTVKSVTVKQGQRVTKKQMLATLDPEPFEINLAGATSDLQSAQAGFSKQQLDLDRQRKLYERGWISKAGYEQALSAFESAEGSLNVVRSRLSSAQRDLNKTKLAAPFAGTIAERKIDPFVEVKAGQALFSLHSNEALDVELSVPDAVIGRISIGLPVVVEVSTVPGCGCGGRITEIGSAAGAANAVTVKASLIEGAPGLLPGMTAEITIVAADDQNDRGYLVPLAAVAPAEGEADAFVFKYDQASGTVIKTAVKGAYGRDNLIAISDGVAAGDILAGAGVSFLRDGQKVKLAGQ